MSNGYFQIGCSNQGTILKLIKPTDGGEMFTAKEVTEYLSSHVIMYSASTVSQGMENLMSSEKPEALVLLNKDLMMEIEESYVLRSSADKMTLTARFYPASLRGRNLSADEFINDLKHKSIKHGIDEAAIRKFFANKEYCKDIVVASGTPVVQGTHAKIEYYFETDLSQKPTLKEDGSVDFFNLNTFTQCQKGDILARLIPEVHGTPGMTVFGEPIRPLEVKRAVLKYGRNISISEDKLVLTAETNGNVSLVEGKVFLSDVMEIDNVGPATGNIEFEGAVRVLGNVFENFSVKAKGTVEVKGVVEGAYIESEQDIIIARGMKGMSKGKLVAGNNIIAKFLENATVEAGGYVETESILHSTVSAGTEVIVTGKRGFITGGKVCAADLVRVKTLGTEMGADTIIEVGADPKVKARVMELGKNIQEANKLIEQSKPTLESFAQKIRSGAKLSLDQKMYMQSLVVEDKERKANVEEWKEEYEQLQDVLEKSGNSCVEVTGDVYPGTKICISDVSMVVKTSMTYCKFKKIDGDVKMVSL